MKDSDITKLIKQFQGLVRTDVVGITSTDARDTITNWLRDIGEKDKATRFEYQVYKYQTSPKIRKLEEEYDNQ